MSAKSYAERHIGPNEDQRNEMLKSIGIGSIGELIERTVPEQIRSTAPMGIDSAMSESDYLNSMSELAAMNKTSHSFIGMGYHPTIVPSPILRNILSNPGWYTAYTPYQAEISQGRLEALLNFQTMVSDLSGLPVANASLLDEGTAAAEAMLMLYASRSRQQAKDGVNRFFVDSNIFPQTLAVLRSRSIPQHIELVEGSHSSTVMDASFFGALIQYPGANGEVQNVEPFIEKAKEHDVRVALACDPMALVLLKSPGELGAVVAVGSTQRFGVPMGYGGPHAAFFATTEDYKRLIPGRIIGVSMDRHGNKGLRMALQTREQHIRRDKATSNICTAQALLAVMAGMYAVYHGPEGIRKIASTIHEKASAVAHTLSAHGVQIENSTWFDTICFKLPANRNAEELKQALAEKDIEIAWDGGKGMLSLNEASVDHAIQDLLEVICGERPGQLPDSHSPLSDDQLRKDSILDHTVFNSYHTETDLMRYMKRLENMDISLTHGMIPLGSCTMKLNAASTLLPITMPGFANQHPFSDPSRVQGYHRIFSELHEMLGKITGLPGVSLQPNSGAQGEFAGLMVIRQKHLADGNEHRTIVLIPKSAHGTNPASAVMAGMKVVVVACDDDGNIDLDDLRAKAEKHSENLGGLMVTYPSTHGVFEEGIKEMTGLIHKHGGLVYMDGANMNAQVGLTSPGAIGADVCHLNLHKTFAIPHGGGGPGMGPICCTKELEPFLPGHPLADISTEQAIPALSAAPWGSALILLISYGYIRMLGEEGLRNSTEIAILNANYIKSRLNGHYDTLYTGKNGTVAHELILDCREFKKSAGVEVADIAKRLIDHGFHAPTVSFPVAGTLMIEPTESESQDELDRFCDSMITIRQEIAAIESGDAHADDNLLKNAPHTALELTATEWNHSYSREAAAYPTLHTKSNKYWPPVARVDNAYGDRNLVCTCPPMEEYMEEAVQ